MTLDGHGWRADRRSTCGRAAARTALFTWTASIGSECGVALSVHDHRHAGEHRGRREPVPGGRAHKNEEWLSLLAKLSSAVDARAGPVRDRVRQCEAFVNELQAQGGKGVDARAASIMIVDAQFLIATARNPDSSVKRPGSGTRLIPGVSIL
jgi:hypothetical protein